MLASLASRWWVFLIRGIAAIVFGVLAVMWPGIALGALTILFGAYAFVDGVFALGGAFSGVAGSRWWVLLVEGLVGLVVAGFVLTQPFMSAAALIYVIAFWAIATGVLEIIAGIQLRDVLQNEWLYVLGGIASIVFDILVLRDPGSGALAIIWIIAFYAILFGILQIGLSIRLNRLHTTAGAVSQKLQSS
jgi:uncharacterized membrane protein HdeD (DUF308 family)